jgi:hypothetical protein
MRDYLQLMEYLRPLLPFLILGTTAYFARRVVRAVERSTETQRQLVDLRAQVAQLAEGLENTERDVMRLQAANDFAVQLLHGRVGEPR